MNKIKHANPIDEVSQDFLDAVNARTRQWRVEAEVYFDGPESPPTIFTEEDIVNMELLEELADDTNPLGVITANELDITFSNDDRRFTPTNTDSPYHGKLKQDILIVPYLGLVIGDDQVEGVCLGEFWTKEWDSPSDEEHTYVNCLDRLHKWGKLHIEGSRTHRARRQYVFLLLVLHGLGFDIDPEIVDFEPNPSDFVDEENDWLIETDEEEEAFFATSEGCHGMWIPSGKAINVLSYVCKNFAFVDATRDGKLRFRPLSILRDTTHVAELNDTNQIMNLKSPGGYSDVYTRASVRRYLMGTKSSRPILETSMDEPGEEEEEFDEMEFEEPIGAVTCIAFRRAQDVSVSDIHTTATTSSFKMTGGDAHSDRVVGVEMYGRPIGKSGPKKVYVNESLEEEMGKNLFEIDCPTLQFTKPVRETGQLARDLLSDPYHRMTALVRGNPALIPGNIVKVSNASAKVKEEIAVLIHRRLRYDGGVEEEYKLYVAPQEEV